MWDVSPPTAKGKAGIDMGAKDFLHCSGGEKINYPDRLSQLKRMSGVVTRPVVKGSSKHRKAEEGCS